jgi:hypothetical protein
MAFSPEGYRYESGIRIASFLLFVSFEPNRVFKNKHQAVSQGVRRFGKRSIFENM